MGMTFFGFSVEAAAFFGFLEFIEQWLAVHAAEQPARKANTQRHGRKPTVTGNNIKS